jgi:hypothetical protein
MSHTFKWRVIVRDQFDRLVEETEWTVLSTAERALERLREEYAHNLTIWRFILDSRD